MAKKMLINWNCRMKKTQNTGQLYPQLWYIIGKLIQILQQSS